MRWKQFFTPVKSFNADEAKKYINRAPADKFTLLDVRQPGEYESEHIPGAKLIPLPDLNDRMTEIDADEPTIVYCAIGGRSRVAAQMLAGKGFKEVFNLSGSSRPGIAKRLSARRNWDWNCSQGKNHPRKHLLLLIP